MDLAVAAVAPAALALDKHPAIIVAVSGKTLSASAQALDVASAGAISNALTQAGFDGKPGQTLALYSLPGMTGVQTCALPISGRWYWGTTGQRRTGHSNLA